MSKFPLLKLPLLAMIDVLKCLDPIELLIVSQCSGKVAKLVPLAGTDKFHMAITDLVKVEINQKYMFTIQKAKKGQNHCYKIPKIHYKHNDDSVRPKADLYVTGREVDAIIYLSKTFQCPIKRFEVSESVSTHRLELACNEIIKHQGTSLEELSLIGDPSQEMLDWMLNKFVVTKKLEVYGDPDHREKIENYSFPQHPPVVRVVQAPWFTLTTLSSLHSCTAIHAFNVQFSNQDIDDFMKLWKAGNVPKLEYLYVSSSEFEGIGTILDIPLEQLNERREDGRWKIASGCSQLCIAGRDIQADDGTNATLNFTPGSNSFSLFVWRD